MNTPIDFFRLTPVPVQLALIGCGAVFILIIMLKPEAGDNFIKFLGRFLSLFRGKRRRP